MKGIGKTNKRYPQIKSLLEALAGKSKSKSEYESRLEETKKMLKKAKFVNGAEKLLQKGNNN